MKDDGFHDLILAIYQTVSEPELWPEVLNSIKAMTSSHGVIIWEYGWTDRGRKLRAPYMTDNYTREAVDEHIKKHGRRELHDQDLFEALSLEVDDAELVGETDLYPDQAAYLELPHVKDMMSFGIRHRYGGILNKDNTLRGRFSIQRSQRAGEFSQDERKLLSLVLPHLAKALDLRTQLDPFFRYADALLTLMEKLTIGACLIDMNGNVVETNTLFEAHLERFSALRKDRVGKLVLSKPEHQRKFSQLLDDVRSHGQFGARPRKEAIVCEVPNQSRSLCVEVVPSNRVRDIGTQAFGGAWVFTRDTMEPISVDIELVQGMFGLTDAECALVDLVCGGFTNAQIAERRNRSQATINTQVKAILSKSRAANRTQFVRMLCNFTKPSLVSS